MSAEIAVEHADFVEIALRFLAALHSRSFRPGGENFDKQWQLQEALNRPVEHDQRQRLLSICLGQRDLSVPLSAELSECFFRAVGRQLHLFEGWTMFNLQELMHWDGGMRRLKDGITSWTIPTLRCQMLPQKIFLQPLLLAKKWGLHFQHSLAKVPGSMWGLILAYLTPPRISWFETVQQRQNHPWWDWPRHPLVFPMLTPSSPPLLASSVVGISIFQGEGSAEDCMHRAQLVSLNLNDVKFVKSTATRALLWERLLMIAGRRRQDRGDSVPDIDFYDALLCMGIYMRLKHCIPTLLLDFRGKTRTLLEVVAKMLAVSTQLVAIKHESELEDNLGGSSSLVVLQCSLAHCISNGGLLDSVRRFLLAQPKGSTPIDAAKRARHVQEHGLYLAMLMADSDLNVGIAEQAPMYSERIAGALLKER